MSTNRGLLHEVGVTQLCMWVDPGQMSRGRLKGDTIVKTDLNRSPDDRFDVIMYGPINHGVTNCLKGKV